MHYCRSSWSTRKGCRKLPTEALIHYTFLCFFYPWLTNRPVKIFSLSYANLFYYCFVSNYWKVFIVLKLSYFTKIFERCPQPIIIDAYYSHLETLIHLRKGNYFFKTQSAVIRLFVTQRRRLPFY